jgi:hypothetical protein
MVLRWNTAVNSADPGALTYFAAIHVQPVRDHASIWVEEKHAATRSMGHGPNRDAPP